MKINPQMVTSALQLYFSGESLRNTQKFLAMQGVKVCHKTIYNWIQKYVGLMEKYLQDFTPKVGDTWRTDEMFVKFSGNMKYLFAMMDDETRFRISQMVADHKGTDDVRPMFREAIQTTGKLPKTFISDGADNFHDAYRKEMLSPYGETQSPVHVRHIQDEWRHEQQQDGETERGSQRQGKDDAGPEESRLADTQRLSDISQLHQDARGP